MKIHPFRFVRQYSRTSFHDISGPLAEGEQVVGRAIIELAGYEDGMRLADGHVVIMVANHTDR